MKIRIKLTLWFTLLVALIVGLAGLWSWFGFKASVYAQAEQELNDKQQEVQLFIDTVSESFQQQHLRFDLTENIQHLEQIFANDQTSRYENIFIQLADTRGKIISRSRNLGQMTLPVTLHPVQNERLKLKPNADQQISILYASHPIRVHGVVKGALQLGLSMVKSEGFLNQILLLEMLGLLFSIFLSLLFGQILAQRALTPMLEITRQVQRMNGQDLFRQLDTQRLNPDEIGILAETFNSLLRRISVVFEAQQHFLSDASHEFKTPLTAIRGHAQLLQKRGGTHPDILAKSSETIIREVSRLNRLVNDLLLLARLEARAEPMQPVSLRELLAEIYEDLAPLHPQLHIQPGYHPLLIMGNPDSLRRVFLNVLDNALKADPVQGVEIKCHAIAPRAEIRISDHGPGIAAEHLPHVFERFYRVESDRNKASGGSGIGLALAYEIMKLHQGQITVNSQPGQGTEFILSFPASLSETTLKYR